MTLNAAAARTITAHSRNDADALAFMLMLGIVGDDGELLPDDTRSVPIQLTDVSAGTGIPRNLTADVKVRPRISTAPEGLRNLAPVMVTVKPAKAKAAPKVKKAYPRPSRSIPETKRKIAKVAQCGTPSGYDRHRRQVPKEPACDACKAARRDYQAKYVAARRLDPTPKAKRTAERPPCGTRKGYAYHRRWNEPTCIPCRASETARVSELRRKRKARSGRTPVRQTPVKCGDRYGARAHRRRNQDVCGVCREAERVYDRGRKRDRRKQPAAQSEAA